MQSIVQQRGNVKFAAFANEKVYMREFFQHSGLPTELKHWQETVDAMLDGVKTDEPIYLMIDQGIVKPGTMHRRGGLHIDGYWVPGIQAHGQAPSHQTRPGHQTRAPSHMFLNGEHGHRISNDGEWPMEGLILASNYTACRAFNGVWDGEIGDGGDCSHIDVSNLSEVVMQPSIVYAGNVTMLHESLPIMEEVQRTVVRLNVKGWSPEIH